VAEEMLRLVIRTPREVALDVAVRSLRVASDSGQVGLHPGCEPAVLAVEPGLALAWTREGLRFVATAGGVLRCDGRVATLLSPIAAAGDEAQSVRTRLEEGLAAPGAAGDLRRAIERLEAGLLRELRHPRRRSSTLPPETMG